jgi:hypothetical protein
MFSYRSASLICSVVSAISVSLILGLVAHATCFFFPTGMLDVSKKKPDLVGGGAVAEREDAGTHDAGERERARTTTWERENLPVRTGLLLWRALLLSDKNRKIICAILYDTVGQLNSVEVTKSSYLGAYGPVGDFRK